MKKVVAPTIAIMILVSALIIMVAGQYSEQKSAPVMADRNQTEVKEETADENTDEPVVSGKRMTAEAICIVINVNEEESQITLRNIKGGEDKILSYNTTTHFLTRHNGPLVASEIKIGDIVDVSFTTYDSMLSKVKQSESAWENRDINKFTIDENGKTIMIGDELYRLAKNLVIASGDKLGKALDITALDTITVRGIDKDVYSIQIEKGHGYIRVKNDSYFVGGWIEIGQNMITILSESMLIPVTEGKYDVKVTNKGYVGRENLKVERDKETILDLSKIEIEEVAIGHVMFTIIPDFAQLYVDGLMTDFEERVPLEYGIHSIRVEMPGYETVHANIRVASKLANITVELDKDEETSSSSDTDKTSSSSDYGSLSDTSSGSSSSYTLSAADSETSGSSTASTTSGSSSDSTIISDSSVISDNKRLYVEGPTGVEVYLDGAYIGIAPCNTQKVTGSHTITLAKSGYETKSYTINIGNDGRDLTMSFSELTATQ